MHFSKGKFKILFIILVFCFGFLDNHSALAVTGTCGSTHYNCVSGTLNGAQGSGGCNEGPVYTYNWNWKCDGDNGSMTCYEEVPICGTANGASFTSLDSSATNLCYSCHGSQQFSPTDFRVTSTGWTWVCRSKYGNPGCSNNFCLFATPINCSATKVAPPVNGVCNATHYNCNAGTSINNLQGGASWAWQCRGLNGGSTATCSQSFPSCTYNYGLWGACVNGTQTRKATATNAPCTGTPVTSQSCSVPVNGVCNATHYNCNAGTSINNLQGGASWAWQCRGLNGGSTATCSQSFPSCTYNYGLWGACVNGTQTRKATATNAPCTGTPVTSQSCSVPVNGVCNATHYNCNAGTSINNLQGGASWAWQCRGLNGGSTATCSQSFPSCTYNYGLWGACVNGTQTRKATATNAPCTGTPVTSQSCSVPVNGVCNATHYNCNAGTSISNSQTSSSWTWTCQGSGGGTSTACSQSFPTCTYIYGSWGACVNGTQTRTATAANSPCTGTSITSQPCGTCGPAAKTYFMSAIAYEGAQCTSGTPSNTTFPEKGATVTWTCTVAGGTNSSTCSANRLNINPSWTED